MPTSMQAQIGDRPLRDIMLAGLAMHLLTSKSLIQASMGKAPERNWVSMLSMYDSLAQPQREAMKPYA